MRVQHLFQYFLTNFNTFTSKNLTSKDVSPNCPLDLPLTCHNETEELDSCCFEYPGGIFLQSQFWNYRPSRQGLNESELVNQLGPLESFTVHGLWPDNCMGSYEQFCDKSLFIDDVYYLLHKQNETIPLYDFMNLYWKSNIIGNDESLWVHEYNKHGSCIKTIRPKCYIRWNNETETELSKGDQQLYKDLSVVDYFNITKNLFQSLDTYKILKKANIIPSVYKTYTKKQISEALKRGFDDHEVFFNCNNKNELQEIWYFHVLKGSLLNEQFIPMDSLRNPPYSRCRNTGIKYYPKGFRPNRRYRSNNKYEDDEI
ncbi:ribonuclease T2-like [Monosporozyma unispora]